MATFRKRALVLASLGALGASAITLASLGELQRDTGVIVVPPPVVQPVTGGQYAFAIEPTFEIPQTWSIEAHVRFALRGSGYPEWIPALEEKSHLGFVDALLFTRSKTEFETTEVIKPTLLVNFESTTRTSFLVDNRVEANLLLQLNAVADKAFTTNSERTAETGLRFVGEAETVYVPASIKTNSELTIAFAGTGTPLFEVSETPESNKDSEFVSEIPEATENLEIQPSIFAHTASGNAVLVNNTTTDFVASIVPEAGTFTAQPEIQIELSGAGANSFVATESPSTHSKYVQIDFGLSGDGTSEFIQAALPLAQQKEQDMELFILAMVQAIIDEDDKFRF